MTDKMIRRFSVDASFIETTLAQTRVACQQLLVGMMKDDGYVPLLDVNPVWATEYRGGDKYVGTLTMQGVYVGKDIAWQVDGVMDGKSIPSIPNNK